MKYVVYGKKTCPFCTKAINLLKRKDVQYEYVNLHEDEAAYEYLVNGLGLKKVPQVFVENGGDFDHIGGFDELKDYLA